MLSNKRIVLGVSGSIAAYKGADLASKLVQSGAIVDVIMTKAAMEFVTPLTFRAITHRPVVTDWYDSSSELSIQHVQLAEEADLLLVAPATADIIAKLALGIADDPLCGTALATRAPMVIAPAMDANMYDNPATAENVAKLKSRGAVFAGPGFGRMASGLIGHGRLAETPEIIATVRQVLGRHGDLAGKHVVVSSGPTEEPIDPVRVITNRSSGKMGFAIAEAARDRGARVTVIAGPVSVPYPFGVDIIPVHTALEMRDAVFTAARACDVLIMTAAVADYRPVTAVGRKIKKEDMASLTIELTKNPDIISEVKGSFIKVGFAAETEELLRNAQSKLRGKEMDLIVANDVTAPNSGFNVDTNKVTIIERSGEILDLPLMTKDEVANKLLDRVAALLTSPSGRPAKAGTP
ncbi:MAG: bifunctional phosphopantothenoylcysteine decarboxylase/phosphopantothenate--cysteine ligase CoaBC [Dehalococcoidia bacterium]|nr:bifunctional phosphopantothenoylcysteine decarboxylase/phosphopantothenate--cysteine ligase CoaBC [Dehalococcoidia bacterium]